MAQPSVMEIIIAAKDAYSKTFDNFGASLRELSKAISLVGIGALAKDCIDAALEVQKLETSFRSVSGQDAAREMAFVREEAGRLGLDIASAAGEYGKLAAASKGTALEGDETRRIFTALSEASTALGLSGEEAAGALNAVQQMISKGKVSSEELRQQLGERLPGAFQIAAKAMGVSTAELDKMLEQGQVTADDMLPKLAAALHDTYGKAAEEASQKGQAAINRFNNEMLETKAKVGEALMPAFTDILKGMKPLSEAIVFLLKGFAFLGPLIGMTMDKLAALARAPLDGIDATRKKMEEIEANFFKTVDDIQKRYSGYTESSKKTDKELADEKEAAAELLIKTSGKVSIEQIKAAEAYAKAVGDIDRELTEQYELSYRERVAKVEAYYATHIKAAEKNKTELEFWTKAQSQALLKLEEQHKGDAVLIEMDKARAVLDTIRAGNEDRKSLIEEQVNQRVITERQGRREMLEMEADAASRSYDLEKSRFEHISGLYDRQTEPYKKALEDMTRARAAHAAAEAELTREAGAVRREELQKSSLDYQLELQKRLDWLHDSERDGLITHQQAARDKLEAEKNYLSQVAELKRRELADTAPDTVEYKQALAEKYEADRAYTEKRQALEDQINADIIAGNEKAAASAKKAADEEGAAFRALAEGFYAQWDAITNRVIALGPKVAAAFGVSIKDTALKTVDQLQAKLEEVAVSARKAAEAARDIGLFSSLLGEHAKKAEHLTYRYYSQRLAVTELTGQLQQMGLATEWQLRSAASLVKEMDLLNDSDLEDVRGEIDRLTQSLKEAEEQAEDTVNSLRDELDQMLGNKEAIEERDYQAKKDDLLARLADAQEAGNTAIVNEYQEALRLLDELHKRKMANIKEEAEAARKEREKAAAASSSSSSALAPGFAGGGRFPGPDSPVDNLLVRVRSGEWAVNNEAVHFWERNIGRGFMAGINAPLSAAGRQIWERLKARAGAWKDYIYVPTPRMNFAAGGAFSDAAPLQGAAAGVTQVVNIYPQRLDEATVRREVLPVLEKVTRLKK